MISSVEPISLSSYKVIKGPSPFSVTNIFLEKRNSSGQSSKMYKTVEKSEK